MQYVRLSRLFCIIAVFGAAGCLNKPSSVLLGANRSWERQSWPFRWSYDPQFFGPDKIETVMVKLPIIRTRAEPELKSRIEARIAALEDAKYHPFTGILKVYLNADGREVWVIPMDGVRQKAYVVDFRPAARANELGFSVDGPHVFLPMANQSTDPTPASGTPPAGQEECLP